MCTCIYVGGTALEVYFNASLSHENDNKLLLATIPAFDHNNNNSNNDNNSNNSNYMDDEMSTSLINVCCVVRVTALNQDLLYQSFSNSNLNSTHSFIQSFNNSLSLHLCMPQF